MPFIWGSGSAWKILIRSQNTTVKKEYSLCTEVKTRCRQITWFAKGHKKALVLTGTQQTPALAELFSPIPSSPVTSCNHHTAYFCPSRKYRISSLIFSHRFSWSPWRLSLFQGKFISSLGQLHKFLCFNLNWSMQAQLFVKATANLAWYN